MKPADNVAAFRMAFFAEANFSLELGFGFLFSGHIINRLVISSVEKRRTGKTEMMVLKRELNLSAFPALFSLYLYWMDYEINTRLASIFFGSSMFHVIYRYVLSWQLFTFFI